MHDCDYCGDFGAALFDDTWLCEECASRYEKDTLFCNVCGGYTTKEELDTAMCCTDCLAVGVATTVAVTTSLLL